jgi:glutathione-regulated potassium-efflux system ancillary protein KefC
LVLAFLFLKTATLYFLSKHSDIASEQRLLFAFLLSQGGEFAFVVFGAAATAKIFSPQIASILVVVVALSMVITPILLVLHDKIIAPRYRISQQRPDDHIEGQDNPIIIAGFGRFGQIIGRLLYANRIGVTVLDHDPDQIELLRKFGFKIFYGDATRVDLLRAAGAERARAIVVAIDDIADSLDLVDAIKRDFPHLVVIARARNVSHYYDLMDRGVTVIERETFESALQLGRHVLQELGFGAYQARQAAMKFRAHNLKTLHAVYPHYRDQQQLVSMAKQAREELEEMFARDAEEREIERRSDWR